MAVDLQYFKIIAVLISPLALKTRSYELQPGGRWSFFVTFPPEAGISGEELEAAGLLVTYQPDYFVSDHDYAFPYASGQSWNQKMADYRLLVPGQLLSAPIPNYIKLDTESGKHSWHTASETWIPEDGLYDHLVLKLAKG